MEYYQKLMNDENPRKGGKEQQAVVEDDITEITSAEIEMALRNMKNGKLLAQTTYRWKCGRVWEELE